jgi:hypothetical protein
MEVQFLGVGFSDFELLSSSGEALASFGLFQGLWPSFAFFPILQPFSFPFPLNFELATLNYSVCLGSVSDEPICIFPIPQSFRFPHTPFDWVQFPDEYRPPGLPM